MLMETSSQERWNLIAGCPNYEISNAGRIRNVKFKRLLNPCKLNTGYLVVSLRNDVKVKSLCIHHLVANAFIENPSNKSCIDHIDRNRQKNNNTNLRYAARSENNQNKNKRTNATSLHNGVSLYTPYSKWRAQIFVNGDKNILAISPTRKMLQLLSMMLLNLYLENTPT